MIASIFQLNPGRGTLSSPYDSTVHVGAGFYWFSAAFLLFIVLGVLKAYLDDRKWSGKTYNLTGKRKTKFRQ